MQLDVTKNEQHALASAGQSRATEPAEQHRTTVAGGMSRLGKVDFT